MNTDIYIRVVLTVIAICLVALTLTSGRPAVVRAAAQTRCHGEMKATSSSASQASIGASHRIDVTCE